MNARVEYLRRRRELLVSQAAAQRGVFCRVAPAKTFASGGYGVRYRPGDAHTSNASGCERHTAVAHTSEQTIVLAQPTIHCLGVVWPGAQAMVCCQAGTIA